MLKTNFFTFVILLLLPSLQMESQNLAKPDSVFERQLGEVTVTAIKQSAMLDLQPAVATVVSRARIERLNITSMKGISEIAPNFYIPDYGSRMTSSIYVRGIGARIDQPVVGLNVDNVPFLNKDCYDFDLPDIERIEMIRGPQSTLYGRNTMGGLINIYTISPMRYQGVRVMAEGSSPTKLRGALSAYGKLNPDLAMSVAAAYNYNNGYWKNDYNSCRVGRENAGSLRWHTVWHIAPNFSADNIVAFSLNRQNGYPYRKEGAHGIAYNDTCFYKRNLITEGVTLNWRPTENYSLSSITSVQYLDDNMTLDQDFTTDRYFTLTQARKELTITQDIVARAKKGLYDRLTGVFFFYRHTDMSAPVTFYQDGIQRLIVDHRNEANPYYPIEWNSNSFLLGSDFKYPVYGLAAYHQSSFDLGRWKASVGLRLDYEHAALKYHSHCNTSYTIFDATIEGSRPVFSERDIVIDNRSRLDKHFTEFLPKFTITYSLPMKTESDIYFSAGKGYKSGGFNTQMFSDVLQQELMSKLGLASLYTVDEIVSYKPERSWNYELGAHINCDEGRVTTDLAFFYIDCRDQQLTMFPDGTTTGRITTNAGRTRSFGGEVQIHYNPSRAWIFNASYGYTNATFRKFFNGKTDFRGKKVPYAPSSTMFAGLTYHTDFSKVSFIDSLTATVGCRGVGDIYWNEDNRTKQPFYALLQASVSLLKNNWSLDVWCHNITNTTYDTFSFISMNNSFYQRGLPRQAGITLRLQLY